MAKKLLNKKFYKNLFLAGLFASVAGVAGITSVLFYIASDLPSVEELQNRQVIESTKIYDRTGEILIYDVHGEEKRTIIDSAEIPEYAKAATISVEDSSFYTNPAFDWRGILRAIYINLTRGGRTIQGGSTITQQLAKKSFLTDERKIIRKLKELVLAWRLEKRYSKDEILTFYLNQIPYGSNTYGIEAAAGTFFNKKASELALNEAALLAALPNAPSYYSPWGSHVKELMARKDFILDKMHVLGYIDEFELANAKNSEIEFAEQSKVGIQAPHFVTYVLEYLYKKYGEGVVRTTGFKVITTIDMELQEFAEEAVKTGVARNTKLYGGTNGALVASDPKTGQILAMVGSVDYFDSYNEGNFNVATQGLRQPGSTFKPFAYLTAFQKGFTPDTIIWDVPTEFDTTNDPENSYKPENNDEIFRGPVLMKEALAHSLNVPSVKTLYLAGIGNTIKNAEKFGIETLKDTERFGLSLVLGGGEVKLIELVNAYGVFAREGVKNPISSILKIEDKNGSTLEEYKDESEEVVDPQYPRLINDILSDVDLRAGLFRSSLNLTKVPGYQIALKTGTTNDYVDAWTVGYTPSLVVGVWAGNNHREPLKSKGGSVLAAIPMWHDFFSKAIKKYSPETFTQPELIQTDNPILRGELVEGNPHEILHHLNRLDDSQYNNWEEGLRNWLLTNSFDRTKFTVAPNNSTPTPNGYPENSAITINITSPKNGDTVASTLDITATASSKVRISKVESYWNEKLIDTRLGDFGETYEYRASFSLLSAEPQNLLTIRVTDTNNFQTEKSIILFH